MAIFNLTGHARTLLAQCVSMGIKEGVLEGEFDKDAEEMIVDLLVELEATDKPIEITVMVDEAELAGDPLTDEEMDEDEASSNMFRSEEDYQAEANRLAGLM